MNKLRGAQFLLALACSGPMAAQAQYLDTIGVTLLQTVTTNVNGSGIRVAQAEAGNGTTTDWQVNPSTVGQPTNLFTYYSSGGSATTFPNALGAESGHADAVAGNFYGVPLGVATNVAHVDNYDASYFYNSIIAAPVPPNINDPVVNQSFNFTGTTVGQQQTFDSKYDNHAAQYKTLFVSGAG